MQHPPPRSALRSPERSGRWAQRARAAALALAPLAPLAAAGCTEHRELDLPGTQSLAVTLVSPADPGALDRRLPDAQPTVTIDVVARDASGEIDASFSKQVRVYTQFLGTLTPPLEQVPPTTITMTNGVAMGQRVTLPPTVLGPTTLWVDDGEGSGPEDVHGRVAGASPTLWFRTALPTSTTSPMNSWPRMSPGFSVGM